MLILLTILDAIFGSSNTKKARYSEKELNAWGLDEYEKKLVRKGDYDPWDFDEEDLDEDSYYGD